MFRLSFISIFNLFFYIITIYCTECEIEYTQTVCRDLNFDTAGSFNNITEILMIRNASGHIDKSNFTDINIKELTISGSNLESVTPGSLCQPDNLTVLAIVDNVKFPEITGEFLGNCGNLQRFILDSVTIPQGAVAWGTNLENLTTLVINSSKLPETLTKDWFKGLKSLALLDIRKSNLKSFEKDALEDLQNLENLVLVDNELTQINLESLEKLPKLISLDLSDNKLNNTIWNHLRSKTLKVLFLERNPVDDVDVKVLKENLPGIERIFLSSRGFIPEKILQIDRELGDHRIRLVWIN